MIICEAILKVTEDLLLELCNPKKDDVEIQALANTLLLFEKNDYKKFGINKSFLKAINSVARTILAEYLFQEESKRIDYNAMKPFVQFLQQIAFKGVENKNITEVTMVIGYGDLLESYNIKYDEDVINPQEDIYFSWEPKDHLYDKFQIFSNNYPYFDEHVIKALATESDRFEELVKRKNGEDLISYNGAIGNIVYNIEHELKK